MKTSAKFNAFIRDVSVGALSSLTTKRVRMSVKLNKTVMIFLYKAIVFYTSKSLTFWKKLERFFSYIWHKKVTGYIYSF